MTKEDTKLAEELRDKLRKFCKDENIHHSKLGYLMGISEKYSKEKVHEFAKEMNNKFDTDGCRIISAEDVSSFNR